MNHTNVVFQRTDHDCGAACLAMVARAYGYELAFDEAIELSHTTTEGATALGLVQAARRLGLQARGFRAKTLRAVPSHWTPLIAHFLPMHFVVVDRIVSPDKVVILDPSEGRRHLSFTQFDGSCSGIFIRIGGPDHGIVRERRRAKGARDGHQVAPT